MTTLDRRAFCVAATAAALGLPQAFACTQPDPPSTRLHLDPGAQLATMPRDYAGFSIELSALEDPGLYSVANQGLVALFRQLSTHGVLRIGGNTSEFCWWKPDASSQPPTVPQRRAGRPDAWSPKLDHAVTPRAVDNLRAFLDATGWSCIYGLDLGTGSPEIDTSLAVYVARALGPKLRAFQIGNEPDFYRNDYNRLRPPEWGFSDYLAEWIAIARSVAEAVPEARFAGPDVGATAEWVVRFAREAVPLMKDRIVELSGHFYAEGPPTSPNATVANLLKDNTSVLQRMTVIMAAAREAGLPYRMSETNSCFQGGKPGVSDTLASALWGADYMLALAAVGCAGINFHGGSGHTIASGLGGHLPGARDAHDLDVARLGSFYSPLAGNPAEGYAARPLFYGTKLAEAFAGATLVGVTLENCTVNATAYAAQGPDGWRIAVVNKDLTRDLSLDLGGSPFARAELWRLSGRDGASPENVRLGNSEIVGPDAAWSPQALPLDIFPDTPALLIPKQSAALLLERSN